MKNTLVTVDALDPALGWTLSLVLVATYLVLVRVQDSRDRTRAARPRARHARNSGVSS